MTNSQTNLSDNILKLLRRLKYPVFSPDSNCVCMNPPFHVDSFYIKRIGIDESHNRYGEVEINSCKRCNSMWLGYFVEYESFSSSGRWYKGLISSEIAKLVTTSNAVSILNNLPWYFYGGSYFDTTGRKGKGPVSVDL